MRKLVAITAVVCCLIAVLLVLAAWIFGPLALTFIFLGGIDTWFTISLMLAYVWAIAWVGVVVAAIMVHKGG